MKKFTVGLASATVLANLVIGAGNVFAAEYPEDTRGETEAKVTILE
ncbi:YSIRK-type signal peptide-containing protein, partial [Enterococcus faecium]|nr:YSIRK-type signal peptide-containing protein [Enterococcus faecium]